MRESEISNTIVGKVLAECAVFLSERRKARPFGQLGRSVRQMRSDLKKVSPQTKKRKHEIHSGKKNHDSKKNDRNSSKTYSKQKHIHGLDRGTKPYAGNSGISPNTQGSHFLGDQDNACAHVSHKSMRSSAGQERTTTLIRMDLLRQSALDSVNTESTGFLLEKVKP